MSTQLSQFYILCAPPHPPGCCACEQKIRNWTNITWTPPPCPTKPSKRERTTVERRLSSLKAWFPLQVCARVRVRVCVRVCVCVVVVVVEFMWMIVQILMFKLCHIHETLFVFCHDQTPAFWGLQVCLVLWLGWFVRRIQIDPVSPWSLFSFFFLGSD